MRETAANVTAARDKHRLARALVVGQVAVALVLLIGAGLFVRTLLNYEQKDFGFDQSRLLVFGIDPTRDGYHGQRLVSLYSQLLDRVQALPGVRSASLMEYAPFSGWSNNSGAGVVGLPKPATGGMFRYQVVGPDFFRTMGIPILLGRPIANSDTTDAPKVVVVDEEFVKTFLGKTNPIGQRIYFGTQEPAKAKDTYEIIGVAKSAQLYNVSSTPQAHAYFAYTQFPKSLGPMFFQVRGKGDPLALVSGLRDQVARMDPNLPLIGLETDRGTLLDALAQQRLFARLSSIFGLLALVLATIGLYGTMAYTVSRKTHEIGIRMALGARPGEVVRMFVGQGIRIAAIGIAIGLFASLYLTRLTHKLIFGVSPNDPLTFIAAALFFILVCAAACYTPARRATRVAPVRALRYE
jgi:predicted permease